jgi:hypothetical protein
MLVNKTLVIKLKTGSTWIDFGKVEMIYWVEYKNDYDFRGRDPYDLQIRKLGLPSWGDSFKEQIKRFIEDNCELVDSLYSGDTLRVE